MTAAIDHLTSALADRYRIERELGAGAMATVYLAHDLKHDRQVAIKVMRPEVSAELVADRFLLEIRTTANLQHPHIVPVFDSGIVRAGQPEHGEARADLLFYVMPLIEGESLRDRLDLEGPLAVKDAVRLICEVAGALDYAHGQGEPPFTGPTFAAILAKRFTQEAPRLRSRRADTPSRCDSAVSRALARDPAARFASAREFATAFGPAESGDAERNRREHSLAVLPFANLSCGSNAGWPARRGRGACRDGAGERTRRDSPALRGPGARGGG
jgi:hypothetical protein